MVKSFFTNIDNARALQTYQLIRFSILILVSILLVKSGLPVEEIAIYEAFIFLGNFMTFFWLIGTKNAMLSYYPSLPESKKSSFFFNLIILVAILSSILAIGFFIFKDWIIQNLTHFENFDFRIILSLYIVGLSVGSVVEYFYLIKKKSIQIVQYGVIVFAFQFLIVIVPVYLSHPLYYVFIGLLILAFLKSFWMLYLMAKESKFNLDFKLQKAFLLFSIPLMLHMFLGSGMEYIDGFLVTSQFEDPALFAKFRYGARELPLATILVGALTSAMIPEAVENMGATLIQVKERTKKLAHFLFPVSMILLLISPLLFPLVYSDDFKLSARIFNIYLLVLSSRILLPQIIIFGKQHNFILVWSALLELIVNIVLSILFIQYFGILGIAYATVLAYMVNKLIMIVYNYRTFNISPKAYLHLPSYFLYNAMLLICFVISLNY